MSKKNIVVYDLEIENVIDGKNVTWSTYDKMGLSTGCLYDYKTDDYSVYFKDDIPSLCERLNNADLVVGFNTTGFDNNLLRALGGNLKPDSELKNFDMLFHSRAAVGWVPGARYPTGMKLDNHLEATFGLEFMKTGHGEDAPKMWQEKKFGQVISYCLADVKREKMLFEQIVNKQWVETAAHGKRFIDLTHFKEIIYGS